MQASSTHPSGLLQQEVEGVLNDMGCVQLGLTQRNQIAFHVIVHTAVQDLGTKETTQLKKYSFRFVARLLKRCKYISHLTT